MKTYKHLWEQMLSEENILRAIKNSARNKKDRTVVQDYVRNPKDHIEELRNYANNYRNVKHTPVTIYDGIQRKKRTIIVPKYKEQILHHMIIQIISPIFMKSMYEHSYGSIPDRGAHKGKNAVEKWIKRDAKNCKYILKMDVKKYFDSVDQDILISKLKFKIKDEKMMDLLIAIIKVVPSGIPLGFYTSQWFANFYLTDLDHYIKANLYAPHYIRYMDDMVIMGANKRQLSKTKEVIEDYLKGNLHLKLKENWSKYRFHYYDTKGNERGRDLDFMGFRFFRDRTFLRKSIIFKAHRKAKKMAAKEKPTIFDIRQIMSYFGWLSCTNTYNFYCERIAPYVNKRNMRKRLSNYDKRKGVNIIERADFRTQTTGNLLRATVS